MFHALAGLANRAPRRVLASCAAVALLAGGLGVPVFGLLHEGGFTDPTAESSRAVDRLARATGARADRTILALVQLDGGIESARSEARVREVAAVIRSDPNIARALTYYDTLDASMLARDDRATVIIGLFRSVDEDHVATTAIALASRFRGNPSVTIGGIATALAEQQSTVQADLGRAEVIAVPLLFLLTLWVFRGLVAALLPLLVGGVTIAGTLGTLRVLNAVTPISIFALNVATGLGLGLAIDASLFMVSRFREALDAGESVEEAVRTTLTTAGHTVLFSALTVMAACGALMIFPENFLFSVGAAGVIVTALTAATSLLLLPALLRVLGPRVDSLAPNSWQRRPGAGSGPWYRLARSVMRRPVAVAVSSAALMVTLGLPALGTRLGFADTSALPAAASARRVDVALQSQFPPATSAPVLVVARRVGATAGELAALRSRLATLDGAVAVGPPQRVAGGRWILTVATGQPPSGPGSTRVVAAVRGLDSPFAIEVAGQTATFLDLSAGLQARLPAAVAVVALTTMVLLFLMTRSVLLPLKAVLMNLLTLGATLGLLVLVFQDGRLQGPLGYVSQGNLEQTTLVVVVAFVFGLSTDYGCFLLGRIREAHLLGLPNAEAVAFGLERTGRVVTAAALLFTVAIGSFVTSQVVYTKELAVGTSVGVLLDASIVRGLLVPSLMALFGRWNWWAPRPWRATR